MATHNDDSVGIQLKEFSIALGQIAEEKGISQERVLDAVEAALSAAYKKDYGKRGQHIRAEFDKESGQAKFFLVKEVVDETTREFVVETEEEMTEENQQGGKDVQEKEEWREDVSEEGERLSRFSEERDITLEEAKKVKKDVVLGDVLEFPLESHDTFGRVAAQTAKQVIIQKIREAERESMFAEYKEKEGEIISGTVQRIEGRAVFIDLGKSTGVLLPSEQSQGDRYRLGQRVKVYVARVDSDTKGPGIVLSRAHTGLVKKLFELEVPEIFAGTVEVKAISREAGSRTKIAVTSKDPSVDPIGSCVGQKGTRVQTVIDELGGEKIDIIEWNEDPKKFITAALSPAKVISVAVDEESKQATVVVPGDQLSLAIGRQGQNVRLASRLTEYRLDVEGETETSDKQQVTSDKEEEASDKEQEIGDKGEETGEQAITESGEQKTEEKEEGKKEKKVKRAKKVKKEKEIVNEEEK